MLTEEVHAGGVADSRADSTKVAEHENAAHEKRNWVRLTFDCNNRCVFCLDSDTHDGNMRNRDEVKRQILDGRRAGATRLILSGGEPTIHPDYVDFIKLGARAGYRKIQTVTNGRLFAYPEFFERCVSAGLSEITFSLHGPNARIHDALVGVKGAFEQEIDGLGRALADPRVIVNVDVVINRANVKQLAEMLEKFTGMGVREFDLLQVVPFGRAFTEGKDTLFYDLEEMRPYLLASFEYSKRPDLHIWLNRFPPQHLEGFEHLIQDPYKLNDEVRGRKEEFARLLDEGAALDCRAPARCAYCYLEQLCDTLEDVRAAVKLDGPRFDVLRVDSEAEALAVATPVFGGDPASAKRARADGKVGLSLLAEAPAKPKSLALPQLAEAAGARGLWVRAPSLEAARKVVAEYPALGDVELELDEYLGLAGDLLDGHRITRATASSVLQLQALLQIGTFSIVVLLGHETAAWLLAATPSSLARIVIRQPTHERLTDSATLDVDLPAFFAALSTPVPVEDVPACITGRAPSVRPVVLDAAMLDGDAHLEIFRYTRRYVLDHYYTKSLRCKGCAYNQSCDGLHVNYVRAHGYAVMQPVLALAPASASAE